jgi:hypothetical protein
MDNGIHWVTLRLKNVGSETLQGLDVKLHTLDSYSIRVLGTGEYFSSLAPEEQATGSFQVEATVTSEVYVSVSGSTSKGPFSMDSPWATIEVTGNAAELISIFAMTMPYTPIGKAVRVEARVKGLRYSENLDLEFWARKPSGDVVELARIDIQKLSGGEEQRYSAEITPKEEGFYIIHGYLYDNYKRVGLKTDTIWVEEQLTPHTPFRATYGSERR